MSTGVELIRSSNGQMVQGEIEADPKVDLQKWLDQQADLGQDRLYRYTTYQEYYRGYHNTRLTDRARTYLEVNGIKFRENFCETVIDVMAERMKVTGFRSRVADVTGEDTATSPESAGSGGAPSSPPPEPKTPPAPADPAEAVRKLAASSVMQPPEKPKKTVDDQVEDWCRTTWENVRGDAKQTIIHATTFIKGDAVLMVDWDVKKDQVCFTVNKPDLFKFIYSDEDPDYLDRAVKVWNTDKRGPLNPNGRRIVRMNLYFDNRIEKWFKPTRGEGDKAGGWSPWVEPVEDDADGNPGEPEPWPLWWTDTGEEDGEPLGIPVFHFKNRSLTDCHGFSELDNVIPEQQVLNKFVLDLQMILDSSAWQQRWATGVDSTLAADYKHVPGELWVHSSPDAKFGTFPNDKVEGPLAAIEQTLSRMARRSRIPLHLLTSGDMPSGEALRAAESGLIKKVEDRTITTGNTWEDAMLFAMALTKAKGGELGFEIPPTLFSSWMDPSATSEVEKLQSAVQKKAVGVSMHTILTELGYNPDVEESYRNREQAIQAQHQAAMGLGAFGANSSQGATGNNAGKDQVGRPPGTKTGTGKSSGGS